MKKVVAVVGYFIFLSTSTLAQEPGISEFSIEEAKQYALEHNKTLLNAKDDVNIANAQLKEAIGNGLPQVSGTFDYMTNFNYEAELSFGASNSSSPNMDFSLLDSGDIQVLNFINEAFGSSGPSKIVMEDQASANLQVSQLIFSGQYWTGIQLAKIAKTINEKNITITELDIKEQVINTYHLILVSEEFLRIINENEKNLQEILTHTQNMYTAGMAELTDVDQIKISLSQLKDSKKSMERNLQLNYNMFRFVLGIDDTEKIALTQSLQDIIDNTDSNPILIPDIDFSNNPTFQIMETQEDIGKTQIKMQKWNYAPTLVGFYSYKEKVLTTGFDLTPKHAAGLTLNVPIYSGGIKNAQLSKAKIELDKVKRNKELLEENLTLQEKQLTYEFNSSIENYFTQKENIEVAKRLYKSINNKYKQGMVSSLDLTQANSNYLQAENNYIQAVLNLLQTKIRLNKLNNNL